MEAGDGDGVAVFKGLEEVALRSADPRADAQEGIVVEQLPDHGGAELVIDLPLKEEVDALLHRLQAGGGDAGGFRVAVRAVFDVHRHVIDQLFSDELLEQFRPGAVGIQLDGKGQGPDVFDQGL